MSNRQQRFFHSALTAVPLIALLSANASACGGVEFIILPLAGGLLLSAILYGIGSRLKDRSVGTALQLSALWISAPVALFAGAGALKSSGRTMEWKCSFSASVADQITYHIIIPLILVMAVLWIFRKKYPAYNSLEISFWAVFGLWGAAFMSFASVAGYNWKGGHAGYPWQVLHYSTIVAFCIVPIVMPMIGTKMDRLSRVGVMFLSLGALGFTFGFILQAF